ncbi:oxygenase MpaB family protein [Streptomyces syringium]|uniref:oxygenase MpaB family protein n=1 Tax=Streptomyces syringium TaxID=76729 RepID=UPI00342F8FA4
MAPRHLGPPPRGTRYARARHLATLDAERDHAHIYRISSGLEFPWDYQRALELALLRTFAVPAIGGLIDATGQFAHAGQRRYDDTLVLMAALAKYGYDSPEGRTALRTINRAHSWYAIDNADLLYTLSAFVFEPIRWIGRYGWRPLVAQERVAAFHFYRNVGLRMNIRDIPGSYEDFERYNREYEALRFAPAPGGRRVADHAVDVACHWVPGPLRPVMRTMVIGLMDEPLRRAFAYPEPRAMADLARLGLRLRARGSRLLPPRRRSFYDHPPKVRSYPGTQHDYTVDDFGVSAPTAVEPRWRRRT